MKLRFIPYDKNLVSRARELRANQTMPEQIFWKALMAKEERIKYKFSRQKPLDNFIVDFYCSELLLAVEIDGGIHLSSQIRDRERDEKLLEKYGILVVRYSNDQIINDVQKVLDDLIKKIESRIFRSPPDKGD